MLIFDTITGLLAPHQCISCEADGSLLCENCISEYFQPSLPRCIGCMKQQKTFTVCNVCKRWLPLKQVYFCGVYEEVLELLIKELKFGFKRQAVVPISKTLSQLEFGADSILCPIPTAPARIRQRGFDHTKLIARELAKLNNMEHTSILRRNSNTRQLGSTRTKRIEQMKEEFYTKTEVKCKNILLIDDVFTTGSTLAAAAETMKKAGAKEISAIIFARKI